MPLTRYFSAFFAASSRLTPLANAAFGANKAAAPAAPTVKLLSTWRRDVCDESCFVATAEPADCVDSASLLAASRAKTAVVRATMIVN